MPSTVTGHGGQLALEALRAFGVSELFTLSGGHVFPIYDAAHQAGVRIVDVRHEQSAVFAAEAVAKLQRRPGVAVLTAGPGITNGISGLTSAYFNAAPVVVLGGRAPAFRWGSGSLQELDHVPLVAPVTKHAATVSDTDGITAAVTAAATPSVRYGRRPRRCGYRCSPTGWAAARCRRSIRWRSPRPAGSRCPVPTWSWSWVPRWTSGSASATSATPGWCTSSTRRRSRRAM